MEESEKRRERLKAMRVEAAQTEVSNNVDTSAVPSCLSNPLIETPATLPMHEDSYTTPRFDFYTDPMSAFSGNKRSKVSSQIPQEYFTPSSNSGSPMARFPSSLSGPRNPEMTPPPTHPFQASYSPDQRMYQARGPYHSSGSHRSPIGMASPFPSHQGTPPGVAWNRSGGTAGYYFPSNSSRGGNTPGSGFGQVGSPSFNSGQGRGSPSFNSGQGRGQWFSSSPGPGSGHQGSPSPNSGRGRGRWFGNTMSPGSGRGGRRGYGSHVHVSTQDGPERFYNKSMVEDPWKFLKPVVWSRANVPALNTPDSLKSWLPKSVSMKKARVSEASSGSSSQPSLAEYLAASFSEAVNDAPGV